MASNALNKVASAMQKRAGAWEDFKAGAYSTLNNPDTWRLAATYGAPIVGGGVLGALLNRKNRLLGAALGMGGGAAVGGGLHALQAYNVGGLGDKVKGLFDSGYTEGSKRLGSAKYEEARNAKIDALARLRAMGDTGIAYQELLKNGEPVEDVLESLRTHGLGYYASDPKVRAEIEKRYNDAYKKYEDTRYNEAQLAGGDLVEGAEEAGHNAAIQNIGLGRGFQAPEYMKRRYQGQ